MVEPAAGARLAGTPPARASFLAEQARQAQARVQAVLDDLAVDPRPHPQAVAQVTDFRGRDHWPS